MNRLAKYLPPLALVGALSLVPLTATGSAAAETDTVKELDTFFRVFKQVRAAYVDKVDDKALIKGAIDGMLASLDPHSGYEEGSDYTQLKTTTDGNYGGLGLTVAAEDGAVKVITPTEDTPAYRAGLKAGDYITHIDGRLLYGFTLDESVEKMRGQPGTKVKLTIVRPGREEPFDVTLVREKIDIRAVKWEVRDNIGIININQFSGNSADMTEAAVRDIEARTGGKVLGYVVDLRSNPGGLLDQAVRISDVFLGDAEVVSERGREAGEIERFRATAGDMTNGKPVVVLIDAGSASAAEIVAGALQDNGRALVMGERSFGKGSVQTVIPMGEKAALRLTTARYYTPSGRSVQAGGIEPDVAVPQLSDPDYKASRPRLREADLRRHLVNVAKVEDAVLEIDAKPDPRFAATAAQLKAKGVSDFQLSYAIDALRRQAGIAPSAAPAPAAKGGAR